jgi:hypothetical protein
MRLIIPASWRARRPPEADKRKRGSESGKPKAVDAGEVEEAFRRFKKASPAPTTS